MSKAQKRQGQKRLSAGDNIRIWMITQKIRPSDCARDLGVNRSAITNFLAGKLTSQRIRQYFIDKGCSEQLLDRLGQAA